jgi:hypothetical protein
LVFAGFNALTITIGITAHYLASSKQKKKENQKKRSAVIKELCQLKCNPVTHAKPKPNTKLPINK